MPAHLQRGEGSQPHPLWLHQPKGLPAQVLWRVCGHRRPLLHPVQVQDHPGGVSVSQRSRAHLAAHVDPGLLLQPQLQKPQRHLRRAGELLWLPRGCELKDVNLAFFSLNFKITMVSLYNGIFLMAFSYWKKNM